MKTPLALACALLLACTGIAAALPIEDPFPPENSLGTPDGIPPSEETVCDGLTGAAHGLCTAYCEAMDCDSTSPQASPTACDRVASRFEQITGGAPPCVCPCVGRVEGWIEALNGDFGLQACVEIAEPGFFDFVGLLTVEPELFPGSLTGFVPGTSACGFVAGDFILITPEESENCNALVRQKAEEAGLTCEP